MNKLIEALFCDNPELPTKVYTYCNSIPEYAEAEREYEEALSLLRARLGDLFTGPRRRGGRAPACEGAGHDCP